MGIRINLGGEVIEEATPGRLYVVMYAASVVGLLLLFLMLRFFASSELSAALERKDDLTSQLAQLEKKTKEYQDLEAKREDLTRKLEVIARLKLSKRGPIRMLNDLNIAIPEKLWINEFRESANKLEIQGLALDNPPIVDFMKNLERSEYFVRVDLGRSDQAFLVREVGKISGRGRDQGPAKGFRKGRAQSSEPDQVFVLKTLQQLTSDQRMAFQQDKPGAGLKVRMFTINADITYVGKSRLQTLEDLIREAQPSPAADRKGGDKKKGTTKG